MKQVINNNEETKLTNPILIKILQIIKTPITSGEINALEKKIGFNKTILKIIESDKTNKNLAIFLISEISAEYFRRFTNLQDDKTVAKIAILKDSSMYFHVSKELMVNTEIGISVLESMVREGKNYFEIEDFIEKYFKKNKNKLYKRYKELLEEVDNIYSSDINKQILILKDNNNELYNLVIKLELLTKNSGKIEINKTYVTNITRELSKNKKYLILDKKEQHNFKVNHIEKIFGIKFQILNPDERFIFDSLLNLLIVSEAKDKLTEKIETENLEIIDIKKNNNKNDNSGDDYIVDNNNKNLDEFTQLLYYSYPESYAYKVDGGYNVETVSGKNIFINNDEKDKFTSISLKNFIKFYNTLYNLGLLFIWTKYSADFKILCNNRFGFDYTKGEGITELKTLSVLNLIGKNIGIPEYEVEVPINNDNNTSENNSNTKIEKRLACYKALWDAKKAFLEIKETGKINDKLYSDNGAFCNGAVENKLTEVGCIDSKGNGLNISNGWK